MSAPLASGFFSQVTISIHQRKKKDSLPFSFMPGIILIAQ